MGRNSYALNFAFWPSPGHMLIGIAGAISKPQAPMHIFVCVIALYPDLLSNARNGISRWVAIGKRYLFVGAWCQLWLLPQAHAPTKPGWHPAENEPLSRVSGER